jgi:hypothetical protein
MCWVNFPPVTGGGKFAAGFLGWALCLAAWLMLSTMAAIGAPAQPITDVGVDVTFDFDNDGERDATYEHQSINITQGAEPYYRVTYFVRNAPNLRFVRATPQRIGMQAGELILATSPEHVNTGKENTLPCSHTMPNPYSAIGFSTTIPLAERTCFSPTRPRCWLVSG